MENGYTSKGNNFEMEIVVSLLIGEGVLLKNVLLLRVAPVLKDFRHKGGNLLSLKSISLCKIFQVYSFKLIHM